MTSTAAAWEELLAMPSPPDDVESSADDHAFQLVALIQRRGEPEVLDWAMPELSSVEPWRRLVASWVLGEHGFELPWSETGRPYGSRVVPALIEAAHTEQDPVVREWLVAALAKSYDPATCNELLGYVSDPAAGVRVTVARGLGSCCDPPADVPTVRATLITMTRDKHAGVRDWATFSIGGSSLDGPDVRDALWARTSDDDPGVEEEAIRGLSRRRDPRALPLMLDLLAKPDAHVLTFEAAAVLADPALLPALLNYDSADPWVREAQHECDPDWRAARDRFAELVLAAICDAAPNGDFSLRCDRFKVGPYLYISATPTAGDRTWSIDGLQSRTDKDPARAVTLVLADLDERAHA